MSLIHLPRLRRATQDQHQQLERLPALKRLLDPCLSLQEYANLLQCFFHLYRHLERQMHPFFGHLKPEAFDWDHFVATPRLEKDLLCLDRALSDRALPHSLLTPSLEVQSPVFITCMPQALGCCYVLLGSGFGAKQIEPLLKRHLGDKAPLCFYQDGQPYLKTLWHQLDNLLSLYAAGRSEQQQAQKAAQTTFELFHYQLSQV